MASPTRYDEIADFYDKFYGQRVQDPATSAVLELAGDLTGVRALDLACGQGRLARALARRGAIVAAVDISAELVTKANVQEQHQPLGIAYLVADAGDQDLLPAQTYGAVLCNLALTDFDDLNAVLQNINRWLELDGRFIFSLPHPCFPGSGPIPGSWRPDGTYFDEGYWRTDGTGIRSRVGSHHRTLASYINALSRHGLTIETALERAWARPELPDLARLPEFLIALARKRVHLNSRL